MIANTGAVNCMFFAREDPDCKGLPLFRLTQGHLKGMGGRAYVPSDMAPLRVGKDLFQKAGAFSCGISETYIKYATDNGLMATAA